MNLRKTVLYCTLIILGLAGFNGFLVDEHLININRSILNLILDLSLLILVFLSIQNISQIRKLLYAFLIFLIITFGSFVLNYNELTATIYFNGLREFLPYFLFPIIYINLFQSGWKVFFIKKFNFFLYLFLILQIPVSLYQLSKYGAGDHVGGTLGTGASGVLTFLVFLSTYFLMVQKFDGNNVFRSFLKKSYLLIFWLPAFINETKISFVLIILFVLLLIKLSITNIRKYILTAFALIPLLFIFDSIYKSSTSVSFTEQILNKDYIEKYLTSDDDIYVDIPRMQKIAIYLAKFNTNEVLLGKGIGQFKGGTTLDPTPFAHEYDWLLLGSRPMFFYLLVQVGLVGAIWFIIYWFYLISSRPIKQRRLNYSGNLLTFSTVCFVIIQFYNDSFRSLFFCGIILFILTYATLQNKENQIS